MKTASHLARSRPLVTLFGETEHLDFAEAIAMLRATAEIVPVTCVSTAELVVLAQSRPGVISTREVLRLRRAAPLAGIVALAGTWCEGEPRTGRPHPGVRRVYWYDFPGWWQRQLSLWSAGQCPDWAQPGDFVPSTAAKPSTGLIALETSCWETAQVLADVVRSGGYASRCLPWRELPLDSRVDAGIWEGRQLDDDEATRLEIFCRQMASSAAPVIALLDFPRRDRCARARELGAAAVLGKPWENSALLTTLAAALDARRERQLPARAA